MQFPQKLLAACVALGCLAWAAGAAAETRFKITLDTGPNHIRNITVKQFVERVKTATNGQLVGEVHEGGSLYQARDEARAVARGDVEMAVTTTSALAAFEPNIELVSLPIFAGLPETAVHKLVDGDNGKEMQKRLAERLGIVVPGRWLLLGFVHTYSTKKPLQTFDDLKGMKIRIPGGPVFVSRLNALGASAQNIPFGDVPIALSQGTVDGLLTTDETIRSGKLTEAGVRFGFHDHIAVLYYVPIVSLKFWSNLSQAHRKAFVESWDSVIDGERREAQARQLQARKDNEAAGMRYVVPDQASLGAVRDKLAATVPDLVRELKLDASLVEQARKAIATTR